MTNVKEQQLLTEQPSEPLPTEQAQRQHHLLKMTLQQFKEVVQLASPHPHSQNTVFPNISQISQQILAVVEMRNSMERVLQVEALQATHFDSIAPLIEQNHQLQHHSNQLALQLKQLQSIQIHDTLAQLLHANQRPQPNINSLIANKLQLQLLQSQLRHAISPPPNPQDPSLAQEPALPLPPSPLVSVDELSDWRYFCSHLQEHLAFRQQLLAERESVFYNYQSSSNELIEALLCEKERDKNLQKAQKEKYQELFRVNHTNDIETEQFNHHESNLVPLYEAELISLKKKLKEQQKNHLLQLNNAKLDLAKATETLSKQKQNAQKLEQQIKELTRAAQHSKELEQKTNCSQQSLANLQQQYESTFSELLRVQRHLKKLQEANISLQEKNESLQSQLNETILKNSQNSKKKQELNKKVEAEQEKYRKLQKDHQSIQTELSVITQELINVKKASQEWQQRFERINSKHEQIEEQFSQLQQQYSQLVDKYGLLQNSYDQIKNQPQQQRTRMDKDDEQVELLQSKISFLQNELTCLFISTNAERKELMAELERRQDYIIRIRDENSLLQGAQQNSSQTGLTIEELQQIKQNILIEFAQQMKFNSDLIDQTIQRLSSAYLID